MNFAGITNKNKWVQLLTSRAFLLGVFTALIQPILEQIFDVKLSSEQLAAIFGGCATALLYLLNKDRIESNERKELLKLAAEIGDEQLEKVLANLEKLSKK